MEESTARRLLEAQRDRLTAIRDEEATAEEELPTGAEAMDEDQLAADAATNLYDREMNASVTGHAEAELAEVEAALSRLEEGTYGLCQECGTAIADERLEAMPATRYCVEHQEVAEKRAGVAGDRPSPDPTATTSNRPSRR